MSLYPPDSAFNLILIRFHSTYIHVWRRCANNRANYYFRTTKREEDTRSIHFAKRKLKYRNEISLSLSLSLSLSPRWICVRYVSIKVLASLSSLKINHNVTLLKWNGILLRICKGKFLKHRIRGLNSDVSFLCDAISHERDWKRDLAFRVRSNIPIELIVPLLSGLISLESNRGEPDSSDRKILSAMWSR